MTTVCRASVPFISAGKIWLKSGRWLLPRKSRGKGIGEALVQACLCEASRLEIGRVFTLTYQAPFFRKLHFVDIDKRDLPHKVWSDCLNCPQFPDCDEEAMIWTADRITDTK